MHSNQASSPSSLFFSMIAFVSFGLLGYALYLQHVEMLKPCPLCILQRYAFAGIGLFALLAALGRATRGLWHGLGMLSGIGGIAVAGYHVWVLLHPAETCGIDPMQNWVNALPTARVLPDIFRSNGLCSLPLPPILGISIPVWSLIWLLVLTLLLIGAMVRRERV